MIEGRASEEACCALLILNMGLDDVPNALKNCPNTENMESVTSKELHIVKYPPSSKPTTCDPLK
jgi:hypothetical protein